MSTMACSNVMPDVCPELLPLLRPLVTIPAGTIPACAGSLLICGVSELRQLSRRASTAAPASQLPSHHEISGPRVLGGDAGDS